MSTIVPIKKRRVELLQGTLDMLILRTLRVRPYHGHAISKHIREATGEVFQVEHGSLYPALHRLERQGWITSRWEKRGDNARELKYYRLTVRGRRQLAIEESQWKRLVQAISQVMWPAEES